MRSVRAHCNRRTSSGSKSFDGSTQSDASSGASEVWRSVGASNSPQLTPMARRNSAVGSNGSGNTSRKEAAVRRTAFAVPSPNSPSTEYRYVPSSLRAVWRSATSDRALLPPRELMQFATRRTVVVVLGGLVTRGVVAGGVVTRGTVAGGVVTTGCVLSVRVHLPP